MPTTYTPGGVEQSLMCLTADPGVKSSILAQSRTFGEIGHEIISTVILIYKRKYVQEVLVACSGKKVWLGGLTIPT